MRIRNLMWLVCWLVFSTSLCCAIAPQAVTTVFVVRHAEKAVVQDDDPPLSEAGLERARLLSRMLAQADVTHLYASQFKRTQQTVQPLAEGRDLKPVIVNARDVSGLVKRVKQESRGGTAVIASHSNLVPAILEQLGIPNRLVITEKQYDDLFVVTLRDGSAQLIHLKYGRSSR